MGGPCKSARVRGWSFTLLALLLLLALPAFAAAVDPDAYEPDNDYLSANAIAIGDPQDHTIDISGDYDWVSCDLLAGQTYIFMTQQTPGYDSMDTVLELYDSTGTNRLAYNDDYTGLWSRIDYTAAADGTYYLRARGYSTRTGNYRLLFTAPGTLSGTVTTVDPVQPIDASRVFVSHLSGGNLYWDWQGYTDSNGQYTSGALPAGDYLVFFEGTTGWACEWYNDAGGMGPNNPPAGADYATINPGANTSGIDASLTANGAISGTVTGSDAQPVANAYVNVGYWEATAGGQIFYWDNYTSTDESGTYTVSDLTPNAYNVFFSGTDDWLGEWFDDAGPYSDEPPAGAGVATVTTGVTTPDINAVLSPAGHITGTVTDTSSGPIEGQRVGYGRRDPDGSFTDLGYTYTDVNGDYDIGGVATGEYCVYFQSSEQFTGEWWDDAGFELADADPVSVAAGSVTSGIDAVLSRWGVITGTVEDNFNNPLADIAVAFGPREGDEFYWTDYTFTDTYGDYYLHYVPEGSYAVWFDTYYQPDYLSEFYSNKQSFAEADLVTAREGRTSYNIDAMLGQTGGITGTVTNASGEPLWGYQVVWGTRSEWGFDWLGYTYTDEWGDYQLDGVTPGSYAVWFEGSSDYTGEWYNDKSDFYEADLVTVAESEFTSDIDAVLASTGSIEGTVTAGDPAGGLTDAYVEVFLDSPWGWQGMGAAYTDEFGQYSIGALPAGDYYVRFSYAGLAPEWFDDAVDTGEATLVTVAAGQVTPAVDAFLSPFGTITGMVSGEASEPVAGCEVDLGHTQVDPDWGPSWYWDYGVYTNEDGQYSLTDLPARDTYKVFFAGNSDYLGEWWDDVEEQGLASTITVTPGSTTPGIDAVLRNAAHVTGTVTCGDPAVPLEDCNVYVGTRDAHGGIDWDYNYTSTDSQGNYDIGSLPPGDYLVWFEGNFDYAPQWWDNAGNISWTSPPDDAGVVTLDEGETATGVDALLVDAAHVSGRVSGGTAENGLYSRFVSIGRLEAGEYVRDMYTWTDMGGYYDFGNLPAGDYVLYFGGDEDYVAEWWNDVPGSNPQNPPANATVLTLATGESVADVDAILGDAGHISGYVTGGSPAVGLWDTYVRVGRVEQTPFGEQFVDYGNAWTDPQGYYDIGGLPEGDYFVVFGGSQDYLSEWWNDVPGAFWDMPPAEADTVSVVPGETTEGIDALLSDAAKITGKVTGGALETPLYDTYVAVGHLEPTAEGDMFVEDNATWTGSDGTYEVGALRAGEYYVFFDGDGQYAPEWWDDAAGTYGRPPADATVISLATAQTLSNIDANLGDAGHITGTVTGPLDQPVENGYALAYQMIDGDWESVGWGYVESDGTYDIGGLLPGEYAVRFQAWDADDNSYAAEYYNDKLVADLADMVEITGTETVTGIDAQLAMGADISGAVSLDSDTYPGAVRVEFWLQTGGGSYLADWDWAYSDEGYQYRCEGLPAGDYKIRFIDIDTEFYPAIYYDTKDSAAAATIVSAVAGEETIVDQELDSTGPAVSSDAVGPYANFAEVVITGTDAGVGTRSVSYRIDDGATMTVNGSSATAYVPEDGERTLEFWATDMLGNVGASEVATFVVTPGDVIYDTIAGANRVETSVKASQEAYPDGLDPAGAKTVVIATAMNWPDALGGTALAGALDCPILLTNTGTLPAAVSEEITRLGATKAVILGGAGAVANTVQTSLATKLGAGNVERIAGADRYTTADLVAQRTIAILGAEWNGTMFVATGGNFPDALAVAPIAAAKGWPLVLAHPTSGVSASTKVVMADAASIYLLGGTGAISAATELDLNDAFGETNVYRLAGADRFATAVRIAEFGVAEAGLGWNRVAVATGMDFPDALAGGVLQGKAGSVMVLTPPTSVAPSVATALTANKDVISEVRFLGGTGAVTPAVRNAIALLLQ